MAVVTPKLQTLQEIGHRFSFVASGEEFGNIVPAFDRFLLEAKDSEYPGAATSTISEASKKLKELLELPVAKCVKTWVRGEEQRAASGVHRDETKTG